MSKNTEIKFVEQPIFKQLVNLIDAVNMPVLINKHNSDYYYKAFKTRIHLITLLFGIFNQLCTLEERKTYLGA